MDIETQSEVHIKNSETYKSLFQTLQNHISLVETSNMRADKVTQQLIEEQALYLSYKSRIETEHAKYVTTLTTKITELEDRVVKSSEKVQAKEKEPVKHHSAVSIFSWHTNLVRQAIHIHHRHHNPQKPRRSTTTKQILRSNTKSTSESTRKRFQN
jgi:uncharacterized protein with von Willebrand factor type A (vWA) domain